MKALSSLVFGAALCSFLTAINPAFAQGTAFTYQGRLNSNGTPASGNYDLRFTIYDSSDGPAIVAGPLTNSAVGVSNGLFAVTLDFGTGVFSGPSRWLDIGVRTNGSDSFEALNPRQAITPSPYAIYASTASGVVSGSVLTSLNNLKDNVTLAAGSNVTITPSGNTLTIASAGAGGSDIGAINVSNMTPVTTMSPTSYVWSVEYSNGVPVSRVITYSNLMAQVPAALSSTTVTNLQQRIGNGDSPPFASLAPYWIDAGGWLYLRGTGDFTNQSILTLAHKVDPYGYVQYWGDNRYTAAHSFRIMGSEDGNLLPRWTMVAGANDNRTHRWWENSLEWFYQVDGVPAVAGLVYKFDESTLDMTMGTNTLSTTLSGNAINLTTNVTVSGHITAPAYYGVNERVEPGIFFGSTNTPTFSAANGSLYLTSADGGTMYFRTNSAWVIK